MLDSALIRPGRVDKRILLPDMSHNSARKIFMRMYSHTGVEHLADLAEAFTLRLPDGKITHAELQGFILDRMDSPMEAVEDVEAWAAGVIEEKEQEKERKEARKVAREVAKAFKTGKTGSEAAQAGASRPISMLNGLNGLNGFNGLGAFNSPGGVTPSTNGTTMTSKDDSAKHKKGKRVHKKSKLAGRVVAKEVKDGDNGWESDG